MPLFWAAGPFSVMNRKSRKFEVSTSSGITTRAVVGREGRIVSISAVLVLETDEPRILDAIALRGRGGKDDALRQFLLRLELDLIVGPGQHPNSLSRVLILSSHSIGQAELFGLETRAKLFQRERFAHFVHHPLGEFAGQSQFHKFPPEQPLFVNRVWNLTRLSEEAAGFAHLDPMIGMDDSGSKRDGRNMPFASSAQAENESQRARWQPRLIGVRDDGGIEQRSGFQGVFGQEIGADQQPPLFGEFLIGRQHLADLFKAFQKELADVLVALGELGGDFREKDRDLVFGKRHDSFDDPGHSL